MANGIQNGLKEKRYVVTYRPEIDEDFVCKVMNGNELARLYGFSDCSGSCDFRVWEMESDGYLNRLAIGVKTNAPLNWMVLKDMATGAVDMYSWPEH